MIETGDKKRGGRPSKPLAERRTERIGFGVTNAQKAAFMVNAAASGLSSNDYARSVLCRDPSRPLTSPERSLTFELIDILSRIGADLAQLRFIAEQTDAVPAGLDDVIARLDAKLDRATNGLGLDRVFVPVEVDRQVLDTDAGAARSPSKGSA